MKTIENNMNKNDSQRQNQYNQHSHNLNGTGYTMHTAHLSKRTSEQTTEHSSVPKQGTNWLPRWMLLTALAIFPTWALAQSDLVMTAVGSTSTNINTKGGYIYVSDTLKNQGTTATTATVRVGYYLSTDNVITTSDTFLGYRNVGTVAAGASNSVASTYVTVPAGMAPGTYYLGAIADYTGLEAESDETNNGLAGLPFNVTLSDLVMTAVASTTTQVNTKGGYIYVSDTLKNQAAVASTASVRVGYYLSTDNVITTSDTFLGYRNVGTVAAGASNSVASTYVTVPAGMAPGTYYLGAIADYTGLEAESDETNNALAGTGSGSTLDVTFPDLVMTAVGTTTPQVNTKGGYINVSDTITNQGSVASTVGVRVGYYLSTDNVITTSDTLLGYRSVGTLAAGASSTNAGYAYYANVPAGLAPGTYYLGAIADYSGLETETNETNNALVSATTTLEVTFPDLVMTAVGSTTSQVNTAGGTIYVSDTLKNQGPVASTVSVRVGYYLSTDDVITTADTLLGYRSVGTVAAGASNSIVSAYVTVPAGLTVGGTYYLGAIADYSGLETETDETNNTLVSATTTLEVTQPDLVMTAVGSSATQAGAGGLLNVSDTLTNQGPVASTVSVRVGYYLSTDNVITTDDTFLGYRTVGILAAGAGNTTAGANYTVPAGTATGNYYLGAIADYSGLQAETDETNNTLGGPMIAIGPDLIMTAVSSTSATAAPGASIAIADTLKNQGGGATGSGCRLIGYYLSTDATITSADTLIGSRQHCGTLAANGTNPNAGVNITLPAGLSIGTYYLGAIADYTGVDAETDETNNSLGGTTLQLTLLPDAPTNVAASGGNAQATVTFSAPVNTGGSAITGYSVTSNPAGGVDSNAGTTGLSHVITGLVNGTAYTFTVTAANGAGTSPASTESNSVIPKTVPGAPLIGTATGGNTQATVTFTAPANNGGATITGYTVSSQPAGGVDSNAGTTGLSHVITGLANGTAYTFTVIATNAAGTSAASAASNSVTPTITVPSAPTNVIAAGGTTQASVSFAASTDNGGSAISGYTVSSTPAGLVDSQAGTTSLNHVMTGLVSGTSYTFTVTATNVVGTSEPSVPSNSVTAGSGVAQAYYVYTDQLDTPRQITDTAGNVVWDWQNLDPFGNNEPNENPSGQGTFEFPLRFTGQTHDKETGLNQNHLRDGYNAAIGGYTQSDPIGLYGGSWSTFTYVRNNPLRWVDPFGLDPRDPEPGLESVCIECFIIPAARIPRIIVKIKSWCEKADEPKPPQGVPENWTPTPTNKGDGTKWTNPDNPHDFVRDMPGNPNSPNAAQQNPYVVQMRDGKAIDVNGNSVSPSSPQAHIPSNQFNFKP